MVLIKEEPSFIQINSLCCSVGFYMVLVKYDGVSME